MAKPNYSYEKRQRELLKKKKHDAKAEEKRQRKVEKDQVSGGTPGQSTPTTGSPDPTAT